MDSDVVSCIKVAQQGFDEWAQKPHNHRWFKKIDGTPIPNDLVVCIAMAFNEALNSKDTDDGKID